MNHEDIDRRSLMMHRIIAARLRARPGLMEVARENLERWNCPERGWWQEWSTILSSQTVEEIACLIEREDEDSTISRSPNWWQAVKSILTLSPRYCGTGWWNCLSAPDALSTLDCTRSAASPARDGSNACPA